VHREAFHSICTLGAELLLLVAVVVLPYLPSLSNGFVYDDMVLIVSKPAPASLSETLSVFTEPHHPSGLQYYRPLSALTFSSQKTVWDNDPLPYHLFNLFLLACVALVVRALFRSLPILGGSQRVAPVAFAAVFALHPLVSSVVHAISGRETLLAVIFMAGACWAFLRAGKRWLLIALLLFAASLLCKEQAVALPLVFVLADWLGVTADSPRRTARSKWLVQVWAWTQRYVPVLLISVGYFVIRAQVFGGQTGSRATPLELALFDEPTRPLLSIVYSLQTIFAPTADLHYEPHLVAWWSTWRVLVTAVAVAGIVFLGVRFGKPHRQTLWLWTGWALVTLLPSANILVQETHYAERYLVLPFLGVAGFATTVASELRAQKKLGVWIGGMVGISLLTMGFLSHHRGQFFENDYRFLTQWAKSDPSSHQARASLGEYHRKRNEYEEAVSYEREALKLCREALPEPMCIKRHFALADVLTKTGRYDEAVAQYEEILRMKPHYSGARRLLNRIRSRARMAQGATAITSSGYLSKDGRARLLESLKAPELTGNSVWFAVTRADPRSEQLQTELEAVFRQAGWQVQGTEVVNFRVKPGLFIFAAAPEAPEYVKRLNQALGKAGLPVKTFATNYRAYSREMAEKKPNWKGFSFASNQDYVFVIGRPGE